GEEGGVGKPRRGANSRLTARRVGRRNFFRIAGAGVTGYFLSPLLNTEVLARPAIEPKLIGKARNCIFILMTGAPSNTDTFDLKVGAWTPADFNPTSYNGVMFPQGLIPNLANQLNAIATV